MLRMVYKGTIDGQEYRFGKKEFSTEEMIDYPSEGLWQLLSKNGVPLAWVLLVDKPREDIVDALTQLSELQIQYQLLSGDRCENVKQFIEQYPIPIHMSSASPQEKLQYIEKLQARGEKVMMVGDGINDVPVLSGADMSLAISSATRLAQTHADAVMLNEGLVTIPQAILLARRVKKTIQQNLLWAIVYNALALPAAAAGLVPPYIAAIGMSASSLIVVGERMAVAFCDNLIHVFYVKQLSYGKLVSTHSVGASHCDNCNWYLLLGSKIWTI